jgi:hypothetical protein
MAEEGIRVHVDRVTRAGVDLMARDLQGPVLTLGPGAYLDLRDECGSSKKVLKWILKLAIRHDRVIAVNIPKGGGESETILVAPPTWSQARLGALSIELLPLLAEAFGSVRGK